MATIDDLINLRRRYINNGWIMDENAIEGYGEDWESGRITLYRRVRIHSNRTPSLKYFLFSMVIIITLILVILTIKSIW